MTFNEHSPEVLDKIRELYHKAVSASISAALLEAMRFGWELKQESMQAQIDALMLEFCPEDMTLEQVAIWTAHQKEAK